MKIQFTPRHKQLFGYIQGSWLKLLLSMVCMLVVAATTSATAFIVKPVIDDILSIKTPFF
ncbi:MAG: hypothetical protein R2861_08405 [Desulfobacterales bacterium]